MAYEEKQFFVKMKFAVSRLKSTKLRKSFKMRCEASMNNAFQYFRNEVKVGYRTIAR